MTLVDEKEILEIEKLKQDLRLDLEKYIQSSKLDEIKITYEAWRLAFYGVAVGVGGTFAIAKTISLMEW